MQAWCQSPLVDRGPSLSSAPNVYIGDQMRSAFLLLNCWSPELIYPVQHHSLVTAGIFLELNMDSVVPCRPSHPPWCSFQFPGISPWAFFVSSAVGHGHYDFFFLSWKKNVSEVPPPPPPPPLSDFPPPPKQIPWRRPCLHATANACKQK